MKLTRPIGPALLLLTTLFHPLTAQVEPGSGAQAQTVRLFMDCRASGCDTEYIRTEVQFVDFVRDIQDSDVYLLATSQATGAGGSFSELIFTGRGRFEGMVDTLTYIGAFDATQDIVREGFTRILKIGLMRFVGLTEMAREVDIRLRPPPPAGGPGGPMRPGGPGRTLAPEDDPWNFWTFRIRGSGGMSGRTNYSSLRFSGSLSASRVTEERKVSLGLSTSYSDTRYDYPDIPLIVNVRRSHEFNGSLIKAVAARWSAGLRASVENATYYNFDFAGTLAPVLEYSFFPYEEATRRSLTLQYAVEASYYDYRETTIFFKNFETVVSQSLSAALSFTRPWGNAYAALEGAHHLTDIDTHHVSLFGGLSLRLGRGLSLTLSGSASRVTG